MSQVRLRGTSPSALASWAITGRSPAAATSSAGSSHLARERVRPARVGAEAPAALAREQLALGDLRARRRRARAARRRGWPTSAAVPLRVATTRAVAASGRGIAADSAASSASSSRRSGSRSSYSRKISRSRERSRLAVELRLRGRSRPGRRGPSSPAAWRSRASSACSVRFCLRLAPEISSTLSSTFSSEPKRWSSSDAVLSPMPGTPGMLSDVSPLRPMKSGTSSGGMP